MNIIRAILFGLPIKKDGNTNSNSEDDYSEEVDSTKPEDYDYINNDNNNNSRTNEREEKDNRSPISQLLIKVSSNLPAEGLNLPSGISDKILRSTSHENHHTEPHMSPVKLYIANTELPPKEETGLRKSRNQDETQLNSRENFQEDDYYDDYSVEVT